MKTKIAIILLILLFISVSAKETCKNVVRANLKKNQKEIQAINSNPEKFVIEEKEFERLLSSSKNSTFKTKNVYLNNSIISLNTKVGDNTQLKVKLSYFKNAHLIIQINGKDSRQIFIVSDDNSVFYSGDFKENKIIMIQCQKDDLFVE
ncbi:MAG: hypothetical protein ACK50A_11300 [Sphingobacteriaceae bacterium]|jgi:hypothetical protein